MATLPSSVDPSDPPLSIEPVIGWRVWRLQRQDDRFVLRSVTRNDVWPPQRVMTARCTAHGHAAVPSQGCRCGLYAAASPEDLARSHVFMNGVCVVGAIGMWGTVVEHARGARSTFAYPARLRLACGPCLEAGAGAVEPSIVFTAPGIVAAVCGRHAESIKKTEGATSAELVQAQLLADYAVEVVPAERLARSLRRGVPASIGPLLWLARPLRIPVLALWTILRMLIGGMFMLWALSGILFLAGAIVVGTFQAVAQALGLRPPEPTPSVVATPKFLPPPPSTAFVEPIVAEPAPPHGLSVAFEPIERPTWSLTVVCGRADDSEVTIVPCGDGKLIGLAERVTPGGARSDCTRGWDVYSRGHQYWICWTDLRPPSTVHRWADAPNPWSIPERRGGAHVGYR